MTSKKELAISIRHCLFRASCDASTKLFLSHLATLLMYTCKAIWLIQKHITVIERLFFGLLWVGLISICSQLDSCMTSCLLNLFFFFLLFPVLLVFSNRNDHSLSILPCEVWNLIHVCLAFPKKIACLSVNSVEFVRFPSLSEILSSYSNASCSRTMSFSASSNQI